MAEGRPFPFAVIVIVLIIAGAVLFVSVQRLSADIGAPGAAEGASALHLAAESGDVAGLRAELARGADVDTPSHVQNRFRDGMTPLMLAIESGSSEAVTLLLEAGADVNARSTVG
ncbi:MAG: ankyrin repeat domain-containing protein [Phycisphaerales bacterium]